jgi:hypothetical protein
VLEILRAQCNTLVALGLEHFSQAPRYQLTTEHLVGNARRPAHQPALPGHVRRAFPRPAGAPWPPLESRLDATGVDAAWRSAFDPKRTDSQRRLTESAECFACRAKSPDSPAALIASIAAARASSAAARACSANARDASADFLSSSNSCRIDSATTRNFSAVSLEDSPALTTRSGSSHCQKADAQFRLAAEATLERLSIVFETMLP